MCILIAFQSDCKGTRFGHNLLTSQPAAEPKVFLEVPGEADISGSQVTRALVTPLIDLDFIRRGGDRGVAARHNFALSAGAVGEAP